MIHIVQFNAEDDYGMVSDWWLNHDHPEVPLYALSDNGFVAMYNNNPIAALWAYTTNNSNMAWLEWLITDPKGDIRGIRSSVIALMEHAVDHCKQHGYGIIMCHTEHKGLAKRCGEAGFTLSTSEMKNLVYTGEFNG